MRWTPLASDKVTVGSSPSGTLATNSPMQKTKASRKLSPATSQPKSKKIKPKLPARAAMAYTVVRSWLCKGLSSIESAG